MNTAHLHLLLNHFPVIGTMIGSGLLLWGILKKQPTLKQAAALLLFLMALVAVPVFLTGEPAEETIEKLPGISEAAIEQHESAATLAIWLMGFTGLAAIGLLVYSRLRQQARPTGYPLLLALSVLCFAAMARTGYYGGQIRHTEIQPVTGSGQGTGGGAEAKQNSGQQKEQKEKEDD